MQIKPYIQHLHIELFIWPTALVLLYFMDPHASNDKSFCLLKQIGIPWCPGCGMGHSINYLLHGQWMASLKSHPLGGFAVIILLYRTIQLGQLQIQSFTELKKRLT
ncbi:Protein of unknown function [Chitinophaga sp. CF118]|uniref:DUF2752 domain-containing protein n=1 Tax=Chitinophaga sp. CF118 TaxID=1884367 RepID=UPI0008EECACC|nr:DUF2752 domain-containing protein [Chitinophaga sp. CF118]SFD32933.1 Protein of unknown function [Chitinophaga sp. CF118]